MHVRTIRYIDLIYSKRLLLRAPANLYSIPFVSSLQTPLNTHWAQCEVCYRAANKPCARRHALFRAVARLPTCTHSDVEQHQGSNEAAMHEQMPRVPQQQQHCRATTPAPVRPARLPRQQDTLDWKPRRLHHPHHHHTSAIRPHLPNSNPARSRPSRLVNSSRHCRPQIPSKHLG